jgi:hypothetical protein
MERGGCIETGGLRFVATIVGNDKAFARDCRRDPAGCLRQAVSLRSIPSGG